jgi:hypothetical protein
VGENPRVPRQPLIIRSDNDRSRLAWVRPQRRMSAFGRLGPRRPARAPARSPPERSPTSPRISSGRLCPAGWAGGVLSLLGVECVGWLVSAGRSTCGVTRLVRSDRHRRAAVLLDMSNNSSGVSCRRPRCLPFSIIMSSWFEAPAASQALQVLRRDLYRELRRKPDPAPGGL